MDEPDLLVLRGILDDMLTLMNERSRRDGSHRPEDNPRERDLQDRLLRLHEKLLEDLRNNIVSRAAERHLQHVVTVGNA